MKKLLLTSLLGLALLLPTSISASDNGTASAKELSFSKGKKKKSRKSAKSKRSKAKRSRSTANRGCTYNGHTLYVGKRGGCYYYSGNSKEYVDRSYCSGCN
ncbi:hypothetical protein [Chryseobacterium aquaticum]|uniref:hypothetical protein n=1 Tax=Chryseobacterium aquaticum TaxID=452084 RepID=UPI000AD8EA64|nr:hypothetical protein [Chryseobacterium aquaticum]